MQILYNNSLVSFQTRGFGDAVVLLHGFTGSAAIWDHYLQNISTRYNVIAIDLPGHGSSDSWGEVHTMPEMGNMVVTVLESLEIKRVVVIGHSMGGYVALAMARMYPHMIAGLGLFHSTALADSPTARENRQRAISLIQSNHKNYLYQFIPELFAPENRERFAHEITLLVEQAKGMSPEAIIAAQKGMMQREECLEILKSANFPVMFIAGHGDARIPFETIMPQLSLASTTYCLSLIDCGHMGFIEKRQECLDFTMAFIQTCYNTSAR